MSLEITFMYIITINYFHVSFAVASGEERESQRERENERVRDLNEEAAGFEQHFE
jgi:hypothetical protein